MSDASAAIALPSRRGQAREPRGMPVQKMAVVGGEPGGTRRGLDPITLTGPESALQGLTPFSA